MKPLIVLAFCAVCLTGCVSTEGLQAIDPVHNDVHFTGTYSELADVDSPPVVVDQVAPDYPAVMKKANVEGKAMIALIVSETGKPEQLQVEVATHPLFADAAVAAVRHWRFKPAMKGGKPVACSFTIPLDFRRDERNPLETK